MKQLGYAIISAGVPLAMFGYSFQACVGVVLVGFLVAAIGIIANYAQYHRQGGQVMHHSTLDLSAVFTIAVEFGLIMMLGVVVKGGLRRWHDRNDHVVDEQDYQIRHITREWRHHD